MSLNYDLTKIKDYQDLCWAPQHPEATSESTRRKLNPVTETLILMTIGLGVNGINKKNVEEFKIRAAFWQDLYGPSLRKHNTETDEWEPLKVSDEDIESHLGLHTNVVEITRSAWVKHMFNNYELEYKRQREWAQHKKAERDAE